MDKFVQFPAVFVHIRRIPEHGDFILDAPAENGRMMDILQNELGQLLDGIFHQGGAFRHFQHGDFGPAEQAHFIAAVIGGLGMLVVGEAHAVGADFPDECKVLSDLLVGDGTVFAGPVLMPRYAVDRAGTPVQMKAGFPVQRNPAETGADLGVVCLLPVCEKICGKGIEMDISDAVLEQRGIDCQGNGLIPVPLNGPEDAALLIGQGVPDQGLTCLADDVGLRGENALTVFIH
jgi:hypothetical protein